MSETAAKSEAATIPSKKPRQGRSPAFPFIPLSKALDRAETFRVAEGGQPKHFAPLTSAFSAWKVGTKTGQAQQTVAAMGHFGLFEFQGSGENRSARLTKLALEILLDKRPESSDRDILIQRAALTPSIHAELWKKWQSSLPSDPTLETYLILERGFSEKGARVLMAEYKDTIAFAKLSQPSIISDEITEVAVGDLIQWEVEGDLRLKVPHRVRAIQEHAEQEWVFIEGSETGIPMEEVIVKEKAAVGSKPSTASPPILPLEDERPLIGSRKEITSLDEGDAILVWPQEISADSYHDLEAWLRGIMRKARRRAGVPEA